MVKLMKIWDKIGAWLMLIIVVVLFAIITPNFLTINTFTNILRQCCIMGVISLGYAMLCFMGLVNLSCGSVIGLAAVVGCAMMIKGISPVISVIVMIVICVALTLFDGFACEALKVSYLIFTVATMSLWRGFALLLSGGKTMFGMPEGFAVIGQSVIWGFVPSMVVILIVCLILCYFIMNKLYFGRYLYATGGNAQAAALSGIDTKKVKIISYAIAGVLFGISAVMLLSRSMVATGAMGQGYEFTAIIACVLGGISLGGGTGKVQNVLIGVFLLGIMSVGLNMLDIASWTETLIKGILLLFSFFVEWLRVKANAMVLLAVNN